MIPLKLQIKNFLSYGPEIQTIDFSPYQLICLSGKNGHGKSALLDAITWVIWGQARKIPGTTKADENLLRLGQTQMMVLLDFTCNNQIYRVRREYSKTYGKSILTLDFGILNEKTKQILSLTDKTVRLTQKKIEKTILLTFDSFVNSAFLRQGQANEFSKKTPKERKEIFAQILGLQQYEAVRKLAMDNAKEAQSQHDCIFTFQEKRLIELETEQKIITNLKQVNTQLKNTLFHEKNLEKEKKVIQQKKYNFLEKEKNVQILNFQIKELEKQKYDHDKTIATIQSDWESINKQKINLPEKSILESKKSNLSNNISAFQKIFQKALKLKEQILNQNEKIQILEKQIYEKQIIETEEKKTTIERLNIINQNNTSNINDLEKQLIKKEKNKYKIYQEIKKLKQNLSTSQTDKKTCECLEKELFEGKEQYQKLIAHGNLFKDELYNTEQKELLSYDNKNPSCPLCEQNLSASRKRFLKSKFSDQKETLKIKIQNTATDIKRIKPILLEQHKKLIEQKIILERNNELIIKIKELDKTFNNETNELSNLKNKITKLKKLKNNIEQQCIEATKKLKKHLAENKKTLINNITYKKLSLDLHNAKLELKLLTYNEKEHSSAQIELEKIEKKLTTYLQLTKQLALQSERKKQIQKFQLTIERNQNQQLSIKNKVNEYKNITQQKQILIKQENEFIKKTKNIKKEKELLLQSKGSLENQKTKFQILKKEYIEQQKTLNKLRELSKDYYEIANATSKNGIQALLIENAIPEIEHEANLILAKLTNNQAQIFIESLRDLKKGGTKETLDIKISDNVGIRPYELFSGGEAFRIDFALRIAISKLLARRSGTSLQTLIIDEGFGSQDEEGLMQIMDAIHKIQNDFSKIIIVSHLTSMKNQFPVHFTVKKGAQGSHISIQQFG